MTLTLYKNFSKRNNSTKQPGTGTDVTVYMKKETSVLHPVFLIESVDLTVNYCQWNGRYYFIDDIVLNLNNIYELHCTFDALATWKSAIGSSTQYVLRSADEYDGRVTDTFYPAKKDPVYTVVEPSSAPAWASSMDAGYYVIGIISKNNTGAVTSINQGAVRYYYMSASDLAAFGSKLFDPASYGSDWDPMYKYSFNPIQFISSIKWFPLAPPNSGTLGVFLPVGWEDLPLTYGHLTAGYGEYLYQFTFTRHPQAATRGSYLNSAPYSDYMLVFPPFGEIILDPDQVALVSIMNVIMKIDFITGKATLIGRAVTGLNTVIELFRREVMLGVNVQIAQITQNAIAQAQNAISSTAGVISSALSGNIGGVITSAASGILSAYELKFPRAQSAGTNDSVIGVLGSAVAPRLYERFYEVVDEDNADCGRPLCQTRTISSLPGYILCANAEIQFAGLPEERDAIISFMNGGFFYE